MASKLMKMILVGALLTIVSNAQATVVDNFTGPITFVATGWSGEGIYLTIPSVTNACKGHRFGLWTSMTDYKTNAAAAFSARSLGSSVTVYGTGVCGGDIETISAIGY